MKPSYLLDTNILSSLFKQPSGPVAERIRAVGEGAVCTSIIVACELRFGATRRGSAALLAKVEALLGTLEVLPLNEGVDRRYGELRAALENAGTPIGAMDYLIAAHALALDLTLVTDNAGEFARVPRLAVENWLRP